MVCSGVGKVRWISSIEQIFEEGAITRSLASHQKTGRHVAAPADTASRPARTHGSYVACECVQGRYDRTCPNQKSRAVLVQARRRQAGGRLTSCCRGLRVTLTTRPISPPRAVVHCRRGGCLWWWWWGCWEGWSSCKKRPSRFTSHRLHSRPGRDSSFYAPHAYATT